MAESNQNTYIVNGFEFPDKDSYEKAFSEKKAITYLNSQMDLKNHDTVYALYLDLVEKHVFTTPVGLEYLKQLRRGLIRSGYIDSSELRPVPVGTQIQGKQKVLNDFIQDENLMLIEELRGKERKGKEKLRLSFFLNLVLILLVLAMFAITLTSESVHIFNYKEKIIDQYASWEEELQSREAVLREKEELIHDQEATTKE